MIETETVTRNFQHITSKIEEGRFESVSEAVRGCAYWKKTNLSSKRGEFVDGEKFMAELISKRA